jgi:RHS repeat-associated protein
VTNQLTQAVTSGSNPLTYTYDLNGNRTMSGYQTGSANELTNDGSFTYTYDQEGNLTQKSKGSGLETWYYTYDNLNHLLTVRKTSDWTTNQVTVTYTYDVFGNRIEQDEWVNGTGLTVTRFAYDGQHLWADLNSSNSLLMRRLFLDGVDQPYARIDSSGNVAWYLADHLGSIRDVVNAAGTMVLDQVAYDPYGQITSETNTANGDRYKYTAREWDGLTLLQFNRGRYYDPKLGRWLALPGMLRAAGADPPSPRNAAEARQRLINGNKRFAVGESIHDHASKEWRKRLTAGQKPFAAILGCSDSRVRQSSVTVVFRGTVISPRGRSDGASARQRADKPHSARVRPRAVRRNRHGPGGGLRRGGAAPHRRRISAPSPPPARPAAARQRPERRPGRRRSCRVMDVPPRGPWPFIASTTTPGRSTRSNARFVTARPRWRSAAPGN